MCSSAHGSETDDAVIDDIARAPVAERLPHPVAALSAAVDAVGLGVVLPEGLTALAPDDS